MDQSTSRKTLCDGCNGRPLQTRAQQVRIQVPLAETGTQTEDTDRWATGTGLDKAGLLYTLPPPYQPTTEETKATEVPPSPEPAWQGYTISDPLGVSVKHPTMKQSHSAKDSNPQTHLCRLKSTLSGYVIALRPWSFPASFTPVLLGSCLAYKSQGLFDPKIFILTAFTALCVHAAGNLVNTYFDYIRGVDNKKSDDRTLVDSILEPSNVVNLGVVLYVAGCLGFALLSYLSAARMEHLALIYFCGLSSSFLYTGGLGLKYIAMGDIVIVLTFGPLSVVFSYLCQTGQLSLIPLVYAVPLALNTEAILHCNNTRDMDGDRQAGAITLAILLGKSGSYCLFCFLLFMPYLMFLVVGMHYSPWILLPAASIFLAFRLEKEFRRDHLETLPQQVAQLNLLMGLFFIASLCMADSDSLPTMTRLGG